MGSAKPAYGKLAFLFLVIVALVAGGFGFWKVRNRKFELGNYDLKVEAPDFDSVFASYVSYRTKKYVDNLVDKMTLEEKVGQMFMVGFNGYYINDHALSLINNQHVGGFALLSYNISSEQQLRKLIGDLQDKSETPLFIAVDQEGGVVNRINWGENDLPGAREVGQNGDLNYAYEVSKQRAESLKNLGINMNLAPVADTCFVSQSIMAQRCFGSEPAEVAGFVTQTIKGQRDGGVISVVKHFPGHGRTSFDSHEVLPKIDVSKEQLLQEDVLPFKAAVEEDVRFMMVAHLLFSSLDNTLPASISPKVQMDFLRNELGFEGLIISDDLEMGALKNFDTGEGLAVKAVKAGTDVLIVSTTREKQERYFNELVVAVKMGGISEERIEESVRRIVGLKVEEEMFK